MIPAQDPTTDQHYHIHLPATQCLKSEIEWSRSSQSIKSSVIIVFELLARVFYLFSAIIFTQN